MSTPEAQSPTTFAPAQGPAGARAAFPLPAPAEQGVNEAPANAFLPTSSTLPAPRGPRHLGLPPEPPPMPVHFPSVSARSKARAKRRRLLRRATTTMITLFLGIVIGVALAPNLPPLLP